MGFEEISKFFNHRKILNISLGFVIGLSLGFFLKDIFLWRKKEQVYLFEILKEIMSLKTEIKKLEVKIKKLDIDKKSLDLVDKDLLDNDDFMDAQSSLDEIESFYSFANDSSLELNDFIRDIDGIATDGSTESYNRCYELCENELWKYQEHSEFLWRYAMIAYHTTILQDLDPELKTGRTFTAFNNALTAVKKSPKSSEAHKWLGILYGVTGLMSDTKKRILNGHKFKEHIDKCIDLNPNDAFAYLLKGRFCYQVANLAFYERKLASILFEAPPVATMEEAFECFQKCEILAPNTYGENHHFLSQCYQYFGDYAQTLKFSESAKKLPCFDNEIKIKIQNS